MLIDQMEKDAAMISVSATPSQRKRRRRRKKKPSEMINAYASAQAGSEDEESADLHAVDKGCRAGASARRCALARHSRCEWQGQCTAGAQASCRCDPGSRAHRRPKPCCRLRRKARQQGQRLRLRTSRPQPDANASGAASLRPRSRPAQGRPAAELLRPLRRSLALPVAMPARARASGGEGTASRRRARAIAFQPQSRGWNGWPSAASSRAAGRD